MQAEVVQVLQGINAKLGRIARALEAREVISEDRLYARVDAAKALGVHLRTIDRWIRAGTLRCIRRGSRIYVPGQSILQNQQPEHRSAAAEVMVL